MYLFKILTFLPLLVSCKAKDELIAVSALIRHGARIPNSFYPTDPYRNATWPFVLGDLTNLGVKEMFQVGQWLRRKYSNFLSEKYKPDELYAHSVDYGRCYMTGEATLAGLYPPVGEEIWNNRIRWQPIPVHGSPITQDIETNVLKPCPNKYQVDSDLIFDSPEYPAIIKKYGPLLDYLSKMSGENITLPSLYPLFDTLFSEKKLGLPLPKWAEEVYPQILPAVVLYTKMSSITPLEIEVQTGALVTQILNQFQRAISGENFGTTSTIYRKFMAYFSTEWMLYDFTYGLGLEGVGILEFGAMYLIELRRNSKKGYYVNILYRSSASPGAKAVPWRFKGGGYSPSYESFKKYLEPMKTNTTQWVKYCYNYTGSVARTATGVPIS
ncbi:lysosomal acid phosphatase-like [Coccinella septempunctata]|uniref:lysosomal acid phosphatase-like n=1 Tax=Coccinella septempunctata TaxID=41139 RepID=UPI001D06AB0A|nr:lysosomal acid phosphatase-like [Coccinella septempunctata]